VSLWLYFGTGPTIGAPEPGRPSNHRLQSRHPSSARHDPAAVPPNEHVQVNRVNLACHSSLWLGDDTGAEIRTRQVTFDATMPRWET